MFMICSYPSSPSLLPMISPPSTASEGPSSTKGTGYLPKPGLRYRVRHHLEKRQATACLQAALLSEEIGRPLNRYVVLDLRHTKIDVSSASHAFERIRSGHFVRWFARKKAGYPPTYVWTIEAAGQGVHINWLLHIPPELEVEFITKLERWFKAATGEKYIPPGAIHVGVIGALAERGNGLMPLARYICKGVDPNHARRMFVTPVAQGTTIGKRSGVSRALGKTAIKKRRAAGFEKSNRRRQS